MVGLHHGDAKDFGELNAAERAQSIAATIADLQAAISYHVEHSPSRQDAIDDCLARVDRLRHLLLSASAPDRRPIRLEELLEGVDESNIHQGIDSGPAVGAEVW